MNEGDLVVFSGSGTDVAADLPLIYAWDFDYDGSTFDVNASGENASHTYTDGPDSFTVALRVTDDLVSIIDTLLVTVNNVAPTALLGNDGPVNEGSPATITFSGQTDPSTDDVAAGLRYAYACDNALLDGATYASSGNSANYNLYFR